MQSMDSQKFLKNYELVLEKEFEKDGVEAQWASGTSAHRLFGSEDSSMSLTEDDIRGTRRRDTVGAELSPDGVLLAVSTNAVIRIYHVQSQELRSELLGHSDNVSQLFFAPEQSPTEERSMTPTTANHGGFAGYSLFSSSREGRSDSSHIIAWLLDKDGRQLQRITPIAVQEMADHAIGAISTDLRDQHNLSDNDMDAVRDGFVKDLRDADRKNRVKHLPLWDGWFPSFGTYPFSLDGRSFFYIACGETTQHGEREPDELPQIVVVDRQSKAERCRLKGHTDAIMWAGWSNDGSTIATASWDEYHKIWDANTGECRHTIGPTGGQNWTGAFSPDGQYVLLSGGRGSLGADVCIYYVATGELFARLEKDGLELAHWIRYLDWNPAGGCIAISNKRSILLWHPFEGKIETILKIWDDNSMLTRFNNISEIKWVEGGKKLMLQDHSRTTFVWDRERNVKWRFERPQGMPQELYTVWAGYVEDGDKIVSLHGDRKVRYWNL